MQLQQLNRDFSVCKISSVKNIDITNTFTFMSITDDEISLVCETSYVPDNTIDVEHGWKALKISGILDFGMIGVISKIATLLAQQKISLFVISTFNTDYILLKSENYSKAIDVLCLNDYTII